MTREKIVQKLKALKAARIRSQRDRNDMRDYRLYLKDILGAMESIEQFVALA